MANEVLMFHVNIVMSGMSSGTDVDTLHWHWTFQRENAQITYWRQSIHQSHMRSSLWTFNEDTSDLFTEQQYHAQPDLSKLVSNSLQSVLYLIKIKEILIIVFKLHKSHLESKVSCKMHCFWYGWLYTLEKLWLFVCDLDI